LLILATRHHRRSIIFRRVYDNLKEIMEKAEELLVEIARFNENKKLWRDIPGDRRLEFGSVQYVKDWLKYRGRPHDLKCFDELTEFEEEIYTNIIGWTRTTVPEQRCRVVATCNPPSKNQGAWIIKRWAPWLDPNHPNPAEPGEPRWFANIDGKDTEVNDHLAFEYKGNRIIPTSRTFIPGRLDDNPYLRETTYRSVLQGMPEPLRSQLLYGDFSIGLKDEADQLIPTEWVTAAMKRWQKRYFPNYEVLGVDVSRGGADSTVIAGRIGLWIDTLFIHDGLETADGDRVAKLVLEHVTANTEVNIDVVGVGSSPYDYLKRELGRNRIHPLSAGMSSKTCDRTGTLTFKNKRSEWLWHLRELLDPVYGLSIELPDDDKLLADLTTPKWTCHWIKYPESENQKISYDEVGDRQVEIRGMIEIESKDEIKKRLGRSTDRGDGVSYAFATVERSEHDWLTAYSDTVSTHSDI
jgi:hypothetical protein